MNFIAVNADILLAVLIQLLALPLMFTVLEQWRARASTVPLPTSVPTALAVYALGIVYVSLGLWWALGVEIWVGSLWLVLAGQRWRYGQPVRTPGRECGASCGSEFYTALCGRLLAVADNLAEATDLVVAARKVDGEQNCSFTNDTCRCELPTGHRGNHYLRSRLDDTPIPVTKVTSVPLEEADEGRCSFVNNTCRCDQQAGHEGDHYCEHDALLSG